MKSDVLAPVLAAMNADAAQKLTMKLANKLALPDTAAGRCPPRPRPGRHRGSGQPAAGQPAAGGQLPPARPAAAPAPTAQTGQLNRQIHGLPRVNAAPPY